MSTSAAACNDDFPITIDSGDVTLSTDVETIVSAEVGSFSCADVWFNVPEDWLGRVTVRLYGRIGLARILLRRIALSRVAVTGPVAGNMSGLAISVRGRPCAALELTVQATEGDELAAGQFYLQLWHASTADIAATRGDDSSLGDPSTPVVFAALVGKDNESGALTEVSTDGEGRLRTANEDATVEVGSSRVDLQACKLEYSIVSPK